MTNDLSQCGNCIYHYTYNGRDMCKQVGDDFYLQWKVEDCPYHTTITSATKISDEIYRLRAENAALRERLERSVELPFVPTDYHIEAWLSEIKVSLTDESATIVVPVYIYQKFDNSEAAEARLAELKGGKK